MSIFDDIYQPHIPYQCDLEIPDDAEFPADIIAEKIDELTETFKKPLEKQINAVESIAESARSQAKSSESIAASANESAKAAVIQADIAVKTSKKADIKGWISLIVSFGTLFIELSVNYDEVCALINQIWLLIE